MRDDARDPFPSPAELAVVAGALRDFLAACDDYQVVVMPAARVFAHVRAVEALQSIERTLNPGLLPFGHEGRDLFVSEWPGSVMTSFLELKGLMDRIIARWDVPEMCEDKLIRGGQHGDLKPLTLEPDERDSLARIASDLEAAVAKSAPGGVGLYEPSARLEVSRDPPRATLDGKEFNISEEEAAFLDILHKHLGYWVVTADLKKDPLLAEETRLDRFKDRLPPPLQKIVGPGRKGGGFRMTL